MTSVYLISLYQKMPQSVTQVMLAFRNALQLLMTFVQKKNLVFTDTVFYISEIYYCKLEYHTTLSV